MCKKIIFVMPPRNWFHGIDYNNSKRIIKVLKEKHNLKVYEFNDLDIFLEKKFTTPNIFKLAIIWIKFVIFKKIDFVFSTNASYMLLANIILKKKNYNFFSQILNLKCILKWDHLNEQIPSIIENYYYKKNDLKNYKDYFFNYLDHHNFHHFSWLNNKFISNDNVLKNFYKKKKININNLSTFHANCSNYKLIVPKNEIVLAGYINGKKYFKTNNNISFSDTKNLNNFYEKKNYPYLKNYCDYLYNKKKIELLKNNNINFYGIKSGMKKFYIENTDNFFINLSKFYIIVNPLNPMHQTITHKFYQIFYHGGFCINEMPKILPTVLKKYKNILFYKNQKDLINKIKLLRKNKALYFSIKNKIRKISNEYHFYSFKNFDNTFKK